MENDICTKKLEEIMLELGHPDHLLGTGYLRCAVVLYAGGHTSITKDLYPAVAKICKTTGSRVERAIRHSIEVATLRGDPEAMKKYFGSSIDPQKGKATNSEYIARLARVSRAD